MNVLFFDELFSNTKEIISHECIIRNEYIKLILDNLVNDSMIHVNGFVELLLYQLNE